MKTAWVVKYKDGSGYVGSGYLKAKFIGNALLLDTRREARDYSGSDTTPRKVDISINLSKQKSDAYKYYDRCEGFGRDIAYVKVSETNFYVVGEDGKTRAKENVSALSMETIKIYIEDGFWVEIPEPS